MDPWYRNILIGGGLVLAAVLFGPSILGWLSWDSGWTPWALVLVTLVSLVLTPALWEECLDGLSVVSGAIGAGCLVLAIAWLIGHPVEKKVDCSRYGVLTVVGKYHERHLVGSGKTSRMESFYHVYVQKEGDDTPLDLEYEFDDWKRLDVGDEVDRGRCPS